MRVPIFGGYDHYYTDGDDMTGYLDGYQWGMDPVTNEDTWLEAETVEAYDSARREWVSWDAPPADVVERLVEKNEITMRMDSPRYSTTISIILGDDVEAQAVLVEERYK